MGYVGMSSHYPEARAIRLGMAKQSRALTKLTEDLVGRLGIERVAVQEVDHQLPFGR
jgi:hypothetical protein